MRSRVLALALASCGFAAVAQAGVVLQASGVSANVGSLGGPGQPEYHIENTINQHSLSVAYVSGITDFDAYIAAGPTDSNLLDDNWAAGPFGTLTAQITFALGSLQSIESFALWNRAVSDQGIAGFTLVGSADALFTTPIDIGSFTAVEGTDTTRTPVQVFAFSPVSVAFVRMEVTSAYGECCVSFGEAAFEQAEAVGTPEPASLALLIAGLLGLGLRRRISSATP